MLKKQAVFVSLMGRHELRKAVAADMEKRKKRQCKKTGKNNKNRIGTERSRVVCGFWK